MQFLNLASIFEQLDEKNESCSNFNDVKKIIPEDCHFLEDNMQVVKFCFLLKF